MKVTNEFLIETTTKALISFIPFVGGAVSSVLSDTMAERKQQRLYEFLNQLKDDLENLKGNFKKDFVEQDDFLDIFELTSRNVMGERNEIKRLAYKNILVNAITSTEPSFDDIEQCIRLVENTTENNIYLLRVLSDPELQNKNLGSPVVQPTGNMQTTTLSKVLQKLLPGWQGGQILENLKDLEFLGLILPISNSFQDMIQDFGLSPVVNSLNLKGERFIKYIKK